MYANFVAAHDNQGRITYLTPDTDTSSKQNSAEKVKFDQLL